MPTEERGRYVHLDGLRGWAAVNVMLSHAVVAFDFALYSGAPADSHGPWDIAVSAWPLLLPVAGANFSVCVFLVLSGFVLAHVFSKRGLGPVALAAKRAVRLGLPVLGVTLFSWALLATGSCYNHNVAQLSRSSWLDEQLTQAPNLAAAVRDGAFGNLIGLVPYAASYDSSLWTMPIEFFGSLLLIAGFCALPVGRRLGLTRRLGCLALLTIAVLTYPLYVSLMVCGAAVYALDIRRRLERTRTHPVLLGALLLVALVLGCVPFSIARGRGWDALVSLVPTAPLGIARWSTLPGLTPMNAVEVWHAVGAVLLLIVVDIWPAARRVLARPLAQFLGRISFPLYLVHLPLLMSVGCGAFLLARRAGIAPSVAVALAVVCFAGVSFAVAMLAAKFVDRPAMRLAAHTGRAVQAALDRLAWNRVSGAGKQRTTAAAAATRPRRDLPRRMPFG